MLSTNSRKERTALRLFFLELATGILFFCLLTLGQRTPIWVGVAVAGVYLAVPLIVTLGFVHSFRWNVPYPFEFVAASSAIYALYFASPNTCLHDRNPNHPVFHRCNVALCSQLQKFQTQRFLYRQYNVFVSCRHLHSPSLKFSCVIFLSFRARNYRQFQAGTHIQRQLT